MGSSKETYDTSVIRREKRLRSPGDGREELHKNTTHPIDPRTGEIPANRSPSKPQADVTMPSKPD